MEKCTQSCRQIQCCDRLSQILPALRSRCQQIRVPQNTESKQSEQVEQVVEKKKLQLPNTYKNEIIKKSQGNARRCLFMLESCSIDTSLITKNQVQIPEWQEFISNDIIPRLLEEQTPQQLIILRGKCYQLLTNCIDSSTILTDIVYKLGNSSSITNKQKHMIVQWAAVFAQRLEQGSRPIFHLEAFLARVQLILAKG